MSGGVNVYQFVDGDPILGVDPTGLYDEGWFSWSQYRHDFGGVLSGYGGAVGDLITSPRNTMKFLGTWAGNDWSAKFLKNSLKGAWSQFKGDISGGNGSQAFGNAFGGALIAAGTAGAGFAEGGAFSKMAYITRWDTPEGLAAISESGCLKEGAYVMRGRPNWLNYALSGVVQSDYAYPYASRITMLVEKSLLGPPTGWEKFKGLFGQRITLENIKF